MENEKEFEKEMDQVYPTMRIYVSMATNDGEQLDAEDFLEFCGEKGITGQIREFLDDGLANVYFCTFNQVAKVL